MLFGVMESVSVEKDLCAYIDAVKHEHRHTKLAKKEEEKVKMDAEKSELEEVVGNDITLHSEVIIDALEQEYEVERRYVSLFECISRDLPYPPFDTMVEVPESTESSLQVSSTEEMREEAPPTNTTRSLCRRTSRATRSSGGGKRRRWT
jgi:hypothetical protein